MSRDRSQCVVMREDKILLVEHKMFGRVFQNLPGGGIEEGESPEEAALRELKEECLVDGEIIRPLSIEYKDNAINKVYTYLVKISDDDVAKKGIDPELSADEQTITDVAWLSLNEVCERDRAYLFGAGIRSIPIFHNEVIGWNEEDISYPAIS